MIKKNKGFLLLYTVCKEFIKTVVFKPSEVETILSVNLDYDCDCCSNSTHCTRNCTSTTCQGGIVCISGDGVLVEF
ncbi:hypothetical protein P8452_38156 [Trifolium repens]|nr:hypothetical protein P8452_38156 [Trifolium repens]